MDIILVSNNFAKARSLTINGYHLVVAAILAAGLFLAAVLAAQYVIVRFQPEVLTAEMRAWLGTVHADGQEKQQSYLREGLDTMAIRLGQMQSQLLRLDTLGARLAKLSGMKPQEFDFDHLPPQGGPFIPAIPPLRQEVSLASLSQ